MPRKTKVQAGGIRIDSGEYKAVVINLEEKIHPEYKENYLWTVKVKDPTIDGEELDDPVEIGFFTSRKLTTSAKNKLTQLVKAVLRVDSIEKGEEVDLDEMIGKPLRVVVKDKPSKDGDEIYSTVSDFLPLKKGKKTEEKKEEEKKEAASDKKEEKFAEKKSEKNEEKSSNSDDDDLFNFSD